MDILEKIKEINLLRPQKGDIIIVKVPDNTSYKEKGEIGKYIKESLKKSAFDNDVFICSDKMEFSIIRKEDS